MFIEVCIDLASPPELTNPLYEYKLLLFLNHFTSNSHNEDYNDYRHIPGNAHSKRLPEPRPGNPLRTNSRPSSGAGEGVACRPESY